MKIGEKWRPYRSVAAWYFWRAVDESSEVTKLKTLQELKRAHALCSFVTLVTVLSV